METELQYVHMKVLPEERKVDYSYQVYAGGGMVVHEFDAQGWHRLRTGDGWESHQAEGQWTAYEHLALLEIPGNGGTYAGATAYGLLDNTEECVIRLSTLDKCGVIQPPSKVPGREDR